MRFLLGFWFYTIIIIVANLLGSYHVQEYA